MAFSTQKEFFHVPFMNEPVEYECKRACVKLKSYESTFDDRSWSPDETKQSKFLSDLVTCQTPVGEPGGRGQTETAGKGGHLTDVFAQHGINIGDSLLEVTTKNIDRLELIVNENNKLQQKLEASKDRLKTAHDENKLIKDIMNQKFDKGNSKDLHNKIKNLAAAGKLSKCDENELMKICHKCEDMDKAYELLQAENSQLKRLTEKLSRRANLETIPVQPEKSTDITYLQNLVNCLRKELTMLRKLEDGKLKNCQNDQKSSANDQDAEMLRIIVKERNALREKCKSFKDLELKVLELQKKAKSANHMSECLSTDLDCQTKYISNMEEEMQKMQEYYEGKLQKCKFTEDVLKCQLEEMKEDLIRCKCQAQKADCLQTELACMRNELRRADAKINDYDCQYQQLMYKTKMFKSCGYRLTNEPLPGAGHDNRS